MRLRRWKILLFAIAVCALVTMYQNCAQTPRVELASAMVTGSSYTHTGDETSCLACHSSERPTSATGFTGLNVNAPFDYANHGGGLDCVSCHSGMAPGSRSPAQWANGFFVHKPTTASCIDCHSTQRPATTSGGAAHPAVGDCVSCHAPSLAQVQSLPATSYAGMSTAQWKNAAGVPTVLVNDPAKNVNFNAKTPVYGTNGILASFTTAAQVMPMKMNHANTGTTVDMTQCSTCHSNISNYVGGRFHASLTAKSIAQPTTCTSCHDVSLLLNIPKAQVVGAFTGTAAGINATTNPSLMNHLSAVGQQDCASCHQQSNWASATFTKGQFHRTNIAPTTCVECHAPTRPSGLAGTVQFNHAQLGQGECIGCHTLTATALKTKTATGTGAAQLTTADWAGANPTPSGLAGSTTITVAAVKLTVTGGAVTAKTASNQNFVLQMNHANYQTNCSTCHTSSGTFTGGKFHASQTTQPTSCATCHTAALSGFILGYAVSKMIDHSHSSVVGKDCAICHTPPTAATQPLFKDGSFHANLTTQPSTCKECHSPKILDQPVWGSMNHATIGATDCKSCHNFPGTGVLGSATNPPNWKGSTAAAPATVSLTPPTGTTWTPLTIPHPTLSPTLVGLSCASCHGSSTTARIIGYDHVHPPTGAKCVYCHLSGQAVVGVTVTTKPLSHHGVGLNNDCSSCHNATFPQWSATTLKWSGGSWNN